MEETGQGKEERKVLERKMITNCKKGKKKKDTWTANRKEEKQETNKGKDMNSKEKKEKEAREVGRKRNGRLGKKRKRKKGR